MTLPTPYPAVRRILEANDGAFRQFLDEMAAHVDALASFGRDDRDPTWGRSMFPAFDGAAAYTMVRKARPRRILEIGSGNSTRFLARALRDGAIDCAFTCIDPAPRMPVESLGVEWIPRVLSEDDAEICIGFELDDILFVNSSHILLPGTDVDIAFNRIFPTLPEGVLVHLHDIFLPFDYPPNMRRWRYSEQNALVPWIVTGFFEVVFPAHCVRRAHGDRVEARLGRHVPPLRRPGPGSIWLRRDGASAPLEGAPGRGELARVIGVVITVYMSADVILDCVESLLGQDEPVRLVIVDNASPDDSIDRLKAWAAALPLGVREVAAAAAAGPRRARRSRP